MLTNDVIGFEQPGPAHYVFYDFITKYTDFYTTFCRENESSFCNAEAFHTSSTKNIGVFQILTFEILTKR